MIHIQVQVTELSQVCNFPWNLPIQRIVMQVESCQVLKSSNGWWKPPREAFPLQRNICHLTLLIASHTLKVATTGVAIHGPWGQKLPLWIQTGFQVHQSSKLIIATDTCWVEEQKQEGEEEWKEMHWTSHVQMKMVTDSTKLSCYRYCF